MSKYTTAEGIFYVSIEEPTKKQVKSYYDKTGEIESSGTNSNAPKTFKKATILHTFDEKKYPINSLWMMGESPGLIINFFGDKLIMIQEKDLYARIN